VDKVTVTVTKKHFDVARKICLKDPLTWHISKACLIAQAVRVAFPRRAVCVGYNFVIIGRNDEMRFALPKKIIALINRFDNWIGSGFDKANAHRLRNSLPVTFTMKKDSRWHT